MLKKQLTFVKKIICPGKFSCIYASFVPTSWKCVLLAKQSTLLGIMGILHMCDFIATNYNVIVTKLLIALVLLM